MAIFACSSVEGWEVGAEVYAETAVERRHFERRCQHAATVVERGRFWVGPCSLGAAVRLLVAPLFLRW